MRDAELVEAAHQRVGMRTAPVIDGPKNRMHNIQKSVPTELGNIQLCELAPKKREHYMKKELLFTLWREKPPCKKFCKRK